MNTLSVAAVLCAAVLIAAEVFYLWMSDARAARPREWTDSITLSTSAICADCDTISDIRSRACPRCASSALFPLSRILNRGK